MIAYSQTTVHVKERLSEPRMLFFSIWEKLVLSVIQRQRFQHDHQCFQRHQMHICLCFQHCGDCLHMVPSFPAFPVVSSICSSVSIRLRYLFFSVNVQTQHPYSAVHMQHYHLHQTYFSPVYCNVSDHVQYWTS